MAVFKSNSDVPEIPVSPAFRDKTIDDEPMKSTDPVAEYPPKNTTPAPQNNTLPELPKPDAPLFPSPKPQNEPPQSPQPPVAHIPAQPASTQSSHMSGTPHTGTSMPQSTPGAIAPVTNELTTKKTMPDGKEEPFFVRIDKFKETKENFENVYVKIQEMEKILQNLQIAKDEEDKELEEWKADIVEMKSFLSDIDKEIFNKI